MYIRNFLYFLTDEHLSDAAAESCTIVIVHTYDSYRANVQ